MMDFNPMDEDTPLRDYWQTTDDLDNEDAATIASLATQVLQSKSGYEYGDGVGMGVGVGLEVNEPGVVTDYMYSESRSSPQSQYSTTLPTEPAESFRGLMDDHDRGVQMLEESAASGYDFEPEAREHEASHVHAIDEPTMLSREQYAPESFRSTLNVAAEMDVTYQSSYSHGIEMSAAMTASRVVNGVLSRSYAGTPTEEVVNLQALQSHAPQLTPPQSESRSVSVETPDYEEQEKEPTMETEDQHVDEELEDTPMTRDDEVEDWEEGGGEREENEGRELEENERGERVEDNDNNGERKKVEEGERVQDEEGETLEEKGDRKEDEGKETEGDEGGESANDEMDEMDEKEPTPDTGAQQQLIMESDQRPAVDDDEELPPLQQTPRKRGRPRRSDAAEAPPALTSEQPTAVQTAVPEKDTRAENEEVESAVTDGADLNRAEEMPIGRRRGRPRRSDISEPATAAAPTPAKRRPGRPPKATEVELTLEAAPAAGKRGRSRKNSMVNAAQLSAIALELSAAETPTATTPRKSNMVDAATQTSPGPTQPPITKTRRTEVPSGRRGRARKSDVLDSAQASTTADQEVAATLVSSTNAAPVRTSSKRGRPRKSDMTGATQASIEEPEQPTVELAETGASSSSNKRGRPRKSDTAANEVQEAVAAVPRSSSRRGRPRKSDMTGAALVSTEEPAPLAVEASVVAPRSSSRRGQRKSDTMDAAQVSTEGPEQPTVEVAETGAPSGRRGRPRKSDTAANEGQEPVVAVPRSSSRRGRTRKSDAMDAAQVSTEEIEPFAVEASMIAPRFSSRRGRRRQSDAMSAVQASIDETEPLAVEASVTATPAPSKRGRRPKSDAMSAVQASTEETEPLAVETLITATTAPSKRGRPPKSDATSAAQASTEEVEPLAVEAPTPATTVPSKRGRPAKRDVISSVQISTEEVEPLAVEASAIATAAPSKRGRPPKSAAISATHTSTEELQLSSVEAPVTTTSASSKRGRPRKSDVMEAAPAEVLINEAQLAVDEAPIITTSALEGLQPQASVKTSTTTSGRRGRPPKGIVPLLQAEIEMLQTDDEAEAVESPALQPFGRRGRPSRQADALEERDDSPSPSPRKRRGRGRPPKSESLLSADLPRATVEPGLGMGAQQAEPQEPSTPMDDVSKDLDVSETTSTPAREDMEATPVRKRGRPKAAAVDKPLSVKDMLVTASEKKHGRPPRAIANNDSAEEHGRPVQSQVQEEEEEPAAKRRRTNNDVTMEDVVDQDETQGDAQEDELPNVEDLGDAVAANGTRRKRSSVTWAQPLTSTLTEPKTVAMPSPRLGRRPRLSGEMLGESTKTKEVEQPTAAPPKTLFDMISDNRKMVRQKTYGKRSKR
ncbi:uncharacterized protein Triagg1_8360 [Trichoderma aggressivum f. europaeum]|uniref:AT hook domain-containing protein n=1 Tax=Trichoderma aggressivum f. europaeum TaxID=173218 RepID=A0AAE1IAR7_9HYPO|nr:hypothetical protein Triagg1_8360 [Trichoderma aggressivum f. europaeum]